MKKNYFIKSIFLTIILLAGGNVWADTFSYEFTGKVWSANGTQALNSIDWDLQTDAGYFGYDSDKGQQIGSKKNPATTIELSTDGIIGEITSVAVTTAGASGIQATIAVSVNDETWGEPQSITTSSTEYTFTGKGSGTLKLIWNNSSKIALYIKRIEVTYSTAGIAVLPPVFSVNSGKYIEPQNVEISCQTEGVDIYYTLDGEVPTSTSTPYTQAIAITETTTLKAIAIKGEDQSSVASATYTIIPIIPATVAEFINAEESEDVYYELTGTIGGTINTKYGNFDLTDATGSVYVYGLTATYIPGGVNDQSYASLGLKEGDKITIRGCRSSYNGQAQVKGAYFVKKEDASALHSTNTSNMLYFDGKVINNLQGVDVMVYNLTGALVASGNGNIDMSNEVAGVYIVRTQNATLKIVKQ